MKMIFADYTLEQRTPVIAYIKNYSDFKLAIKVTEGGESKDLELYEGSTKITADAEKTRGYTTFTMSSGGEGRKDYSVKVGNSYLKLSLNVKKSNVSEIGFSGSTEIPIASTTTLGGIKEDSATVADKGYQIESDGKLKMKKANQFTLGMVKVGTGINVTADGLISVQQKKDFEVYRYEYGETYWPEVYNGKTLSFGNNEMWWEFDDEEEDNILKLYVTIDNQIKTIKIYSDCMPGGGTEGLNGLIHFGNINSSQASGIIISYSGSAEAGFMPFTADVA